MARLQKVTGGLRPKGMGFLKTLERDGRDRVNEHGVGGGLTLAPHKREVTSNQNGEMEVGVRETVVSVRGLTSPKEK